MEKQKIFWVVLSVSVLVVVVLIVGIFLLRQKSPAAAPGAVTPISNPGAQVYEYSREKPSTPSAEAKPSEMKPGESETLHFYIGDEGQKAPSEKIPGERVPAAAAAQPETQPPKVSKIEVPTPQKKAPLKLAARPKAAKRGVDFWIQTGSYKSQSKAEELATRLAGKGLPGKVFSFALKGETYYRVRIGPYGNRNEADKFLSIVKQMQGLESSYIAQAGAAKKSVN
jgi:cell division protein FtsN